MIKLKKQFSAVIIYSPAVVAVAGDEEHAHKQARQ